MMDGRGCGKFWEWESWLEGGCVFVSWEGGIVAGFVWRPGYVIDSGMLLCDFGRW